MKGKNNATSKQMALFTYVAQTGMGMISLPAMLARIVGHDGWISIMISGIISVILGVLIVLLLKRYSDKSIFDINNNIYGKALGTIFNVILIIYLLLGASASVRVFSVFLRITLLPRTPVFVIVPFVILPSIYLVYCGLKYVIRFKYISTLSYVVSITYLLLLSKQYRFSFLLPVGEAGSAAIIGSIKTGFYTFLGFELIAFLYPTITDKEQAMKWHIISIIMSTLFSGTVVASSTALFGENLLKIQTIPLFNLGRAYNAPIFERVDLYLIALWFVVMGCSMRAYMFTTYYSLIKVFNFKDSKGLVFSLFLALITISRIPRDINEVFMFRYIISLSGLGVSLFFVLCLFLSFIRRKGVNNDKTC